MTILQRAILEEPNTPPELLVLLRCPSDLWLDSFLPVPCPGGSCLDCWCREVRE